MGFGEGEASVYKEEAFENLKEAWEEFCCEVLAEKGKPGLYKGQSITILDLGNWLLEHIEDNVNLDDDDDDSVDETSEHQDAD
jgi:hypothetical protein